MHQNLKLQKCHKLHFWFCGEKENRPKYLPKIWTIIIAFTDLISETDMERKKSMHKKLFYIGQFKSQSYWKRAHVYMCTQSDMWIQTTSVIRSITLLRVYEKYHSNVCLATMLKSSKKCTVKTHWWPSQSQYSVLLVLQKGRHHYIFKFFYIDLVPKYKYFWKH